MIYAATKGYLDNVPTSKIADWEPSFVRSLREKHPEILDSIKTTSTSSPMTTTKALIAAIEEFNKSF